MIKRVWELDRDNFFIGFNDLTEENEDTLNYTTVPMTVGYYKPKFNKETQEWVEGATEEEIEEIKRQEEENRPTLPPSEVELLKQEVNSLKEQQQVLQESQEIQDFIIDDLVFEVIPSLETQIASDQSKVPTIIKRVNVLTKGMVQYLAKKISEGKDYEEVFKVNAYKQYQEEVDKILGRK